MSTFEQANNRDATVPLDGPWQFSTDPDDIGVDEGWQGKRRWNERSVTVPHSWQEEPELREYDGAGWYRRSFTAPDVGESEQALLRFGAVDYEATIWVNGTEVGRHRGGYLPFHCEVTDQLRAGENSLVVRVWDPSDVSEIPHGKQGEPWYTPVSGIWRSVDLLVVPEKRVTAVFATPDLTRDIVRCEIETTKAAVGTQARIRIEDDGEPVGTGNLPLTQSENTVEIWIEDPTYWHPDSPHLYDITVELREEDTVLDTYTDSFGMRSVDSSTGEIRLNGEPLSVRGALKQGYYPETFYRPADLETYEQEIRTAKELGFNLLRKHIKPAHPEFLRLADELGMLVWQEPANPSRWTDRSKRELRQQFERMVKRDYNSPSLIAWSLYNEEWGIGDLQSEPAKREYLAEFYEDAHALDPTRLVCDNSGWSHVKTDINDYHEYFVLPDRDEPWRDRLDDIVGDPSENYAVNEPDSDPATTPIVISEFGTWGLPDIDSLREPYDGNPHWFDHALDGLRKPAGVDERFAASHLSGTVSDLSELARAWQAREQQSIDESIRTMRANERISGYVITELSDIEWEFNGILDYHREPKEGLTEAFAGINAPVTAWAEPAERVLRAGETLTADLLISNESPDPLETTIEWSLFDESGRVESEVDPDSTERVAKAIRIEVPAVAAVRSLSLSVTLPEDGARTTTELVVAPEHTTAVNGKETLSVDNEGLAERLADRGYEIVPSTEEASLSLLTESELEIDTVASGSDVVVLPGEDGRMDDIESLSFTELPERESWNLCASLLTQTLFEEINTVPGYAFCGLYPYAYVPDASERENSPDDGTEIDIGYTEGWIRNSGGILLRRSIGGGTLTVCTLRVTDTYGDHPIATALLDRIIERATH